MTDLEQLGLVEAAEAVRKREISPVELTEHCLARIEETEPYVHAYVTVDARRAIEEARAAEAAVLRGAGSGALHGIPLGVKDMFDTAGLRTTYGSPTAAHHVPSRDATAVARLRDAGAIVLGKHATHELAWGGRTDSAYFGPTHNPRRRGHIPGGSSGGSAASVAVGSSLGSIGTDTAGSVRIPAALSGCVGFKPTRGRVSLAGVMPLAPSLDHVGVLARTVLDAVALLDVISGLDTADPSTRELVAEREDTDVTALDVAFLSGWPAEIVDPGVASVLDEVREDLSGRGIAVSTATAGGEAPASAVLTQILAEAGTRHRPAFERRPTSFGPDIAELLRLPPPTPRDLARAQATVSRAAAALLELLLEHDVLVLPTVPVTAPRIGESFVDVGDTRAVPIELVLTRLTSIFNVAGLPAVSVPAGERDALPVGVQIVGRPGADHTATAVAALIQNTTSVRTS
ncbi:amidase [Streptomyces incanus]